LATPSGENPLPQSHKAIEDGFLIDDPQVKPWLFRVIWENDNRNLFLVRGLESKKTVKILRRY